MPLTVPERPAEASLAGELDALIEEARRRQRRRRRRMAVAAVLCVAAGVIAFGRDGGGDVATRPGSSDAASPGAVGAFVARADRAVHGRFSATYDVNVIGPRGHPRHAHVFAAQLSMARTMYRELPRFGWADRSYEVFVGPNDHPRGVYSCSRASKSSPWACVGPDVGIGMTAMHAMVDPYPPQALLLGLQNAATGITVPNEPPSGTSTMLPTATGRAPAFLVSRRVEGQLVRCLAFGSQRRSLGSVCLNRDGLIAFFDLPRSMTNSAYKTATLVAYSPRPPTRTLSLPARPKPGDVLPHRRGAPAGSHG